jgi:phosphohistidine phosphatase SixA
MSSAMPASASIFLIRHGEKPESGTGLSPAGEARAKAYVTYFQNLRDPQGKLIHWDHLIASRATAQSDRPRLTIAPLATALAKTVKTDYKDGDYAGLVKHIRQNAQQYANSNILICWHHGEILNLAAEMGGSYSTLPASSSWPAKWPESVFGWLLKLYFKPDGTVHHNVTQAVNQRLMPDDKADPVAGRA